MADYVTNIFIESPESPLHELVDADTGINMKQNYLQKQSSKRSSLTTLGEELFSWYFFISSYVPWIS